MFENSEVYLRSSRRKAFLLYKPLLSWKVCMNLQVSKNAKMQEAQLLRIAVAFYEQNNLTVIT